MAETRKLAPFNSLNKYIRVCHQVQKLLKVNLAVLVVVNCGQNLDQVISIDINVTFLESFL